MIMPFPLRLDENGHEIVKCHGAITTCSPPITTCTPGKTTCPPSYGCQPTICYQNATYCERPVVHCPLPNVVCPEPVLECPNPPVECDPPTVRKYGTNPSKGAFVHSLHSFQVKCPEPEITCTQPVGNCSAPVITCPEVYTTCTDPNWSNCPAPEPPTCPDYVLKCEDVTPCTPYTIPPITQGTCPPGYKECTNCTTVETTPMPQPSTTTSKPPGCPCLNPSNGFKKEFANCSEQKLFICQTKPIPGKWMGQTMEPSYSLGGVHA